MGDSSALLLFDGTCGFCAESVQFVLRRERRRRTLKFAALDSAVGRDLRSKHPELDRVDSVIWVEPGTGSGGQQIYVRSAAVLRVLAYLGGVWRVLGWLGALVPRVVRDWVYDLIARNRHRLIRSDAACLVPTSEQRTRFIDWGTDSAA